MAITSLVHGLFKNCKHLNSDEQVSESFRIIIEPITQVAAEDNNICPKSHGAGLEAITIWKTTAQAINMEGNNHRIH